ncbi:DUF2950 family protein [Shimia sagamensis]|uniref:DUF2950 domain-containing protein n=1 Tax=Shimia sagamensis TaxID=1566352 RepID=A0ABY1P2J8_9RHOB|nr:DUF2950 family protein [Shimia sagamensis]SMP24937.1 Protein of unknown function [Shimia sagamensis]
MKLTFAKSLSGLALGLALSISAEAQTPAVYTTPQAALDSMIAALQKGDQTEILQVFGAEAKDLLSTGNPARDKANRAEILGLLLEGYRFQPAEDGGVVLLLGAEGWPFPIPLERVDASWQFDIETGRDEVLFRRIGLNELDVIEFLSVYVDIQAEYRLEDHDADQVMEFAPSFLSSEGMRDGLFWAGEDSPLGARIALASLDGYSDGETDVGPEPFGGYYYRILHSQSAAAPGGALDYVIEGNMVAGHAVLAVPSDYGNTGIHSFLVSENGVLHEADLGEDSLETAFSITSYDPTSDWRPVDLHN